MTGFDGSPVAVEKARALARTQGVAPAFQVSDILTWDWDAARYDLVVGVFFQFLAPLERAQVFAGMRRALAPGGRLMLHGYTPAQIAYGTGGPPHAENMYTEALLRDSFADLRILRLASYEKTLSEGSGHAGRSALIDLIAEDPG